MKKHIHLQSQAIYVVKKNIKKSVHILEDSASSVQCSTQNCLDLFKTWWKYNKLMLFLENFVIVPLGLQWIQGIWKENPTSNYFSSRNICPKLELAITFWAVFLMISCEDIILIFYIWILNTTMEGTMKISNLTDILLLLFGHLTKKCMFLVYIKAFFSIYLTMLSLGSMCLPPSQIL